MRGGDSKSDHWSLAKNVHCCRVTTFKSNTTICLFSTLLLYIGPTIHLSLKLLFLKPLAFNLLASMEKLLAESPLIKLGHHNESRTATPMHVNLLKWHHVCEFSASYTNLTNANFCKYENSRRNGKIRLLPKSGEQKPIKRQSMMTLTWWKHIRFVLLELIWANLKLFNGGQLLFIQLHLTLWLEGPIPFKKINK